MVVEGWSPTLPRAAERVYAAGVDRRRKKYLNLGIGELVAAAAFILAVVNLLPSLEGTEPRALWAAVLPLVLILAQGGVYWLLARGRLPHGGMSPAMAAVYRTFRVLDVVLLLAAAALVVLWWPERPGAAVLVVLVWLFGVVEYVNYYVIRLAYPVTRWWPGVRQARTPRLIQDLRAQ